MELRHIRYVLAVAAAGNFTRAAAALGIAQPPLSQQIRALESELGVTLFHRVPYGAELTAAGEAFLVEARQVLAAADRAVHAAQRAHRGESGRLQLGFTTSATYNPLISSTIDAFHLRWPDVALSLDEASSSELLDRTRRGDLDAAFVRPGAAEDGILLTPLPDEKLVVALPANHPQARRDSVRLRDLADEPLILFQRHMAPGLRDEIMAAYHAVGLTPRLGQEAHRTADTINLVAAHLGVAIVPASLTQVRLAGVAYRSLAEPAPLARLALATAKGNRSPCLMHFLALLKAKADEAIEAERRS